MRWWPTLLPLHHTGGVRAWGAGRPAPASLRWRVGGGLVGFVAFLFLCVSSCPSLGFVVVACLFVRLLRCSPLRFVFVVVRVGSLLLLWCFVVCVCVCVCLCVCVFARVFVRVCFPGPLLIACGRYSRGLGVAVVDRS
jgi:hypothetical protein